MKPNSNQGTMAWVVLVRVLAAHRKLYRKVSTERKHTWKYHPFWNLLQWTEAFHGIYQAWPATAANTSPSFSFLFQKIIKYKLSWCVLCGYGMVSSEYLETTIYSYKDLIHLSTPNFWHSSLFVTLEITWNLVELRKRKIL
jgi:hypothetical protein